MADILRIMLGKHAQVSKRGDSAKRSSTDKKSSCFNNIL